MILHSVSGKYELRAAFIHGKYRWTRKVTGLFGCGVVGNNTPIEAQEEVVIQPTGVRLVEGAWVVSAFTGSLRDLGTRGCGLLGAPDERYAIRAKRAD